MEQQDRATIDRCCEQMVGQINMDTLWPRLIENRVFNEDDVNVPAWERNLCHSDTVRDILLTIKTRGPRAFENLIYSLRQTDHQELAEILGGDQTISLKNNNRSNNDPTNSANVDNDLMNDDFYKNLHRATKPLFINVRKATEFFDNPDYETVRSYRMRSKPRGYVLIITIITYVHEDKREAAEHDEASLKKLFHDMGFEVTSRTNLTGEEIKTAVKEFSSKDFYHVDSCFVIISAHGAEIERNDSPQTVIKGIDYQSDNAEKVFCEDIIEFFAAENCRSLMGKPKIFIFQACRGELKQKRIRCATDGATSDTVRNYSDILIAYSTIPGHVSYRDIRNGSWYIQILCEVFMNYACKEHVQNLFNMVDSRLMQRAAPDKRCQTSMVQTMGFNKHCYLHPGLFEDS